MYFIGEKVSLDSMPVHATACAEVEAALCIGLYHRLDYLQKSNTIIGEAFRKAQMSRHEIMSLILGMAKAFEAWTRKHALRHVSIDSWLSLMMLEFAEALLPEAPLVEATDIAEYYRNRLGYCSDTHMLYLALRMNLHLLCGAEDSLMPCRILVQELTGVGSDKPVLVLETVCVDGTPYTYATARKQLGNGERPSTLWSLHRVGGPPLCEFGSQAAVVHMLRDLRVADLGEFFVVRPEAW